MGQLLGSAVFFCFCAFPSTAARSRVSARDESHAVTSLWTLIVLVTPRHCFSRVNRVTASHSSSLGFPKRDGNVRCSRSALLRPTSGSRGYGALPSGWQIMRTLDISGESQALVQRRAQNTLELVPPAVRTSALLCIYRSQVSQSCACSWSRLRLQGLERRGPVGGVCAGASRRARSPGSLDPLDLAALSMFHPPWGLGEGPARKGPSGAALGTERRRASPGPRA